MRTSQPAVTRDRILDATQRLIQVQGYSGFSYADVANVVKIRKASIHHYFPSKGDLALALIIRYRERFAAALAAIRSDSDDARSRLRRYQQLFAATLQDSHKLCMCGMLAAEFDALPLAVRSEVRAFFDENEIWLSQVLAQGRRRGEVGFTGPTRATARLILAAFEGAMLVARSHRNVNHFKTVASQVIATLVLA